MKKTILLFLTFLTYQFTFSQCHYVVDMQDSYGDGWNGAQINVSINSVLITSFTVPVGGSSAIDSISTYTGDNVSFDFVSGTWDTEITYTITALMAVQLAHMVLTLQTLVMMVRYGLEFLTQLVLLLPV